MENNFKYIVYQTINIINNKIYIGYHKTLDPFKFDGYIGNGVNIHYPSTYMTPKWPFQMAVKKYGTDKFKRSVLYIFNTEEEALKKEAELVNKDFVLRSDTYNLVEGGKLHPIEYISKKVYQFDTNGKLLKVWQDCNSAAETLQTWKSSIYGAIQSKRRLYGSYWSFSDIINLNEFTNPNLPTKTYKYNKDGKCVAVYDSMYIAAKENGYKLNELSTAISLHSLTKGYYYSKELYDVYIPKEKLNLKNIPIYTYNIDGSFYKKYNNQKDLKTEFGITKSIARYITSGIPLNNFILKLEYKSCIEPYSYNTKKRPVLVYDKAGNLYKEYESVSKAVKELNLDTSTVNKILKGVSRYTKGYTIKYKN